MPFHDPEKYFYDMLSSCEFLLEEMLLKELGS